jgi:hypothetical protein
MTAVIIIISIPLMESVDMTSAVKRGSTGGFRFCSTSSLRSGRAGASNVDGESR